MRLAVNVSVMCLPGLTVSSEHLAGDHFLVNNLRTFISTRRPVAEISVRKGTGYAGAGGMKLIRPRPSDEGGSREDARRVRGQLSLWRTDGLADGLVAVWQEWFSSRMNKI